MEAGAGFSIYLRADKHGALIQTTSIHLVFSHSHDIIVKANN
jgi:hypothetical protein